ncbi:MAG: HAD family phosphatase [Deltaproteobacteria bacterium]|nr:HAD family phosphatase [Deltaproteobacteria bacterium]
MEITKDRQINAVLFDFGGVFTDSPLSAVEAAGAELGLSIDQFAQIMFGPYEKDTDHPWHRLERGEISLDDAAEKIHMLGKNQGIDFDPLKVLFSMGGGNGADNPLVHRVRKLKEDGYQTAIITNNIAEFRDLWPTLIPVDDLFDLVVDSSFEGIRKPNPEIFYLALSRLGNIPPNQSVFLDDYESNVNVAVSLGIHGILVGEDKEKAVQDLDNILGPG